MYWSQVTITIILGMVLVSGCPNRELGKVNPRERIEGHTSLLVDVNRDLDILFVIDNSASMEEEQESLTQNFYRFMDVLQKIEGGLPNIRIGVVTTDVGIGKDWRGICTTSGDNGILQNRPSGNCSVPDQRYIENVLGENGERITNYSGSLADTFSCLAKIGTKGCFFEMPLEAMRKALNGSNIENRDFLRKDAYLAVIIISDEDDCSTKDKSMFEETTAPDPLGPLNSFRCFEYGVKCNPDNPRQIGYKGEECVSREDSPFLYPVREYVDFLKKLKDDPEKVFVAGILGPKGPVNVSMSDHGFPILSASCVTADGQSFADPSIRLSQFLSEFPDRNKMSTICNEDLSGALVLIADELTKIIEDSCLKGKLDTKAEKDPNGYYIDGQEIDYECLVSYVQESGEEQIETTIPECITNINQPPCWLIEPNEAKCSDTDTQLALVVNHPSKVPEDTRLVARCVVVECYDDRDCDDDEMCTNGGTCILDHREGVF